MSKTSVRVGLGVLALAAVPALLSPAAAKLPYNSCAVSKPAIPGYSTVGKCSYIAKKNGGYQARSKHWSVTVNGVVVVSSAKKSPFTGRFKARPGQKVVVTATNGYVGAGDSPIN